MDVIGRKAQLRIRPFLPHLPSLACPLAKFRLPNSSPKAETTSTISSLLNCITCNCLSFSNIPLLITS